MILLTLWCLCGERTCIYDTLQFDTNHDFVLILGIKYIFAELHNYEVYSFHKLKLYERLRVFL